MKTEGEYLVMNRHCTKYAYRKVESITGYDGESCIICRHLDPDFSIFMPKVDLIITESGSKISHLAIVAREYGKAIIRINKGVFDKIRSSGKIMITRSGNKNEIEFI